MQKYEMLGSERMTRAEELVDDLCDNMSEEYCARIKALYESSCAEGAASCAETIWNAAVANRKDFDLAKLASIIDGLELYKSGGSNG